MPADPSSIRAEEVERFDRLAAQWWDPVGPMRELHRMNPIRTGWVAAQAGRKLHGSRGRDLPLAGHRVLDVGCGAGLASEALARMGARVTGIDAAPAAIEAARHHAAQAGLEIEYRVAPPEALESEEFDLVVAYEVIEHVIDPAAFCRTLARLVRSGGLVALSTLNRTPQSWVMAKLGAEYLLRLLPVGTHDWRAFVTPSELARALREAGLGGIETAGMRRRLDGTWALGDRLDVNYLMAGVRA